MLKLHFAPNSRAGRIVWLLEELALPYEINKMAFHPKDLKSDEHRARHPLGRVPVLEDGDTTIFESGARFFRRPALKSCVRNPQPNVGRSRSDRYSFDRFASAPAETRCPGSRASTPSGPMTGATLPSSRLKPTTTVRGASRSPR